MLLLSLVMSSKDAVLLKIVQLLLDVLATMLFTRETWVEPLYAPLFDNRKLVSKGGLLTVALIKVNSVLLTEKTSVADDRVGVLFEMVLLEIVTKLSIKRISSVLDVLSEIVLLVMLTVSFRLILSMFAALVMLDETVLALIETLLLSRISNI